MPYADYGEKINFSASKFTKLKSKGDKIQFRLIGNAYYDGKHFLKNGDEWNIVPCVRINESEECEYCVRFFKAHAKAKKEGLDQKATQKLTDPWSASVAFYFPVINRETQSFEVFQTTKGIRDAIEAEIELGTKVMDRDLVVLRTEKPGKYYVLSVVDSADTQPLTPQEESEMARGKEIKLSEYVHGREDDGELAVEVNTEVEDVVDF